MTFQNDRMRMVGGMLLLTILICFLTGCASASVTKIYPDGSQIKARSIRCLWKTEQFDLYMVSQDGQVIRVRLGKSGTDEVAVGSVMEGITKGAIEAMKHF